jgi:aryl-alcohol dehydrogenase-like predicted oxidoreductase
MGKALKGQRRESLEIFTKVYFPTGLGVNDRGLSRKHIMESCESSLRRLQTDYVDLYQAHRYDYETPLEETLRAFDDLVRQGKVLYVGVSEWTAEQIRDAVRIANDMGFDRIVSNQPQYNMLWRVIESEVVPVSEELGIGQIVWSPIAQGVLTGKYKKGAAVPEGSRATDKSGGADFVSGWLREEVLEAVEKLEPIAQDMNLTVSALAIAWVLSNPNVSAAIVGASRPEQITENAKAAGLTLPEDVLSAIDYALGDLVKTDPALTVSPEFRP